MTTNALIPIAAFLAFGSVAGIANDNGATWLAIGAGVVAVVAGVVAVWWQCGLNTWWVMR